MYKLQAPGAARRPGLKLGVTGSGLDPWTASSISTATADGLVAPEAFERCCACMVDRYVCEFTWIDSWLRFSAPGTARRPGLKLGVTGTSLDRWTASSTRIATPDGLVAPGCEVVSKLTATDHFLMVALRFLAAG